MSYASLERPDTEAEQLPGDLTIQALQEKAQALGIDEAALDDAEEKAELVALISAAQAAQSGADDAAQELMLTSMQTGAKMYVKLYHISSSGTGSSDYWQGAVINGSLSTSASLNDAVNASFSAQGSGSLTYTNS